MAHTDRDNDRVFWREHHRTECPNAWTKRHYGDWTTHSCDVCPRRPHIKYWCSTEGKNHWNREQRQAERGKAKQALRQCRDYDDLTISYRRPWWD